MYCSCEKQTLWLEPQQKSAPNYSAKARIQKQLVNMMDALELIEEWLQKVFCLKNGLLRQNRTNFCPKNPTTGVKLLQ